MKLLSVLLVSLFAGNLAQAKTSNLQGLTGNFANAFAQKDPDIIRSLHTENAVLVPADGPNIVGRDNIVKFYEGAMNSGVGSVVFNDDKIRVSADGKYASIYGEYQLFSADQTKLDQGVYIIKVENTVDGWQVSVDSFI